MSYSSTSRKGSLASSFNSLQISPNLEALLQHDELTRRGSGSPTSLYHPISHPSGFAVSLPPPPPRNTAKKPFIPETRTKDILRIKSANVRSDSWPDALPTSNNSAGYPSPTSSRSTTPNPYINPTPIMPSINNFDGREAGPSLQNEYQQILPRPHRSEPDVFRTLSVPTHALSSHRSSPTLNKMEKMFTKGRESLSILTSVAIPSSLKLKLDDNVDRRPFRSELADLSANQSSISVLQLRQARGLSSTMSHKLSAFGDTDTAMDSNVSPLTTGTPPLSPGRAKSLLLPRTQLGANSPSASSTRSLSLECRISPSSPAVASDPPSPFHLSSLPYLPPISPIDLPSMPFLQQQASNDQQSFIDFFSPASPPFQYIPDDTSIPSPRRPSAPAILSSSIYFKTSCNPSLKDLPSMVFAPPSPTASPNELPTSSEYSRPSSKLSSYSDVSAMVFAPGSPTSGPSLSPTLPRPSSSCSSISSLAMPEFIPRSPTCPNTVDTLKPPIPTSSKPLHERRSRKNILQKRSMSTSPQPQPQEPLPPTINTLHANQRADLIRRNRKLAQLLGQTPGSEMAPPVEEPRLFKMLPQPAFSALLGSVKQRHNHRHVMSVSGFKAEPSSHWQVLDCPSSPHGRRYSTPHSATSFALDPDDSLEPPSAQDHQGPRRHRGSQHRSGSPTSFIDFFDEDIPHDGSDVITLDMPNIENGPPSSTLSLVESLTPQEEAEAERKRKRDKLAKLHRFLGSCVPTDLVVGHIAGPSLPPVSLPEDARDMWFCRRTSSLSTPSFERVKEELDNDEKALNVRRAHKMEKLFGTPPPQTLYHTRHASTPIRSQPTSPIASVVTPYFPSVSGPGSPRRNRTQCAYKKGNDSHRPESAAFLLSFESTNPSESPAAGYQDVLTQSSVYMNYQHSIESLMDIIDRDDKASLAELHRFLHGDDRLDSPVEEQLESDRLSTSSNSHKFERRHSLPTEIAVPSPERESRLIPTRMSIASISTDAAMPSPKRQSTDFQIRRRRAAKLTHFFGVDYCDLIHDILESIEKGLEEEHQKGTLQPEEVDRLLHKLHNLRARQDGSLQE